MKISLISDGSAHFIQQDGKKIFYVEPSYRASDCIYVASESAYFVPIQALYTLYNYLFLKPGFVYSSVSFADVLSEEPFHNLFYFENDNFILKDNISEFVIFDSENLIRNTLFLFGLRVEPVSDFETDLYPELLDNTETVSNLNLYINGGDVSSITDKDLAFQKNIELYNANVLALRATKKVNANVSGSVSQSGEQQQIDLTPISSGLTNIANKLQRVDENQETKNITQTINDLSLSNQTVITTVEKAPYNPLLDDDFEDFQ